MAETYEIDVELTDTYAGEANYAWVKRARLTIPARTSRRGVMRRAKAAMGITGERGRSDAYGDYWTFRPYGRCVVMFAQVVY